MTNHYPFRFKFECKILNLLVFKKMIFSLQRLKFVDQWFTDTYLLQPFHIEYCYFLAPFQRILFWP